jgi:hypothetical protein
MWTLSKRQRFQSKQYANRLSARSALARAVAKEYPP